MRPSYIFLRQSFIRFNKEMFGDRLPEVPLRIGRGRKTLGCMQYIRRRNPDGSESYGDFRITVSGIYDREKNELEDILIHEMIHLYEFIELSRPEPTVHGPFFRKEMQRINRIYGRHVSIREHLDDETRMTDTKIESSIIGIILCKDGKKGITRVARSRIFELYDAWSRVSAVERVDWYFTLLPDIKKYNRAQTLKYYILSDMEINRIIDHRDTVELEIFEKEGCRYARPKR